MQAHRFVVEIEQDRLSAPAYKAYVIYECDFIETALLIFAHMLVKAPSLIERRWLAGALQALVVDQIGYFERTLAALGVDAPLRNRRPPRRSGEGVGDKALNFLICRFPLVR